MAKPLKAYLQDPTTPATVLLVIATDILGPELLTWDPETISLELQDETGTKVSPGCFNKLMAAVELVTTDRFYKDLPAFIRICNVLYNGTFDPESFDPADAMEIAWGITEAMLIWPPDPNDESPFSDQIIQYIGAALADEGIMLPPDVLRLGTQDARMWESVQTQFSDDPQMFDAIYKMEKERTDEINAIIKQRLSAVLVQLSELPLATGETQDAVQRLLAGLHQTEAKGSELTPNVG